MIEISHELTHIGIHFKDVFCCDCFFDETYFLLRQKSSYEIFEERFNLENCYFEYGFSTIIIVCYDILRLFKKKYKLTGTNCIQTRLTHDIKLCSLCTIDLINKINDLHEFRLSW